MECGGDGTFFGHQLKKNICTRHILLAAFCWKWTQQSVPLLLLLDLHDKRNLIINLKQILSLFPGSKIDDPSASSYSG